MMTITNQDPPVGDCSRLAGGIKRLLLFAAVMFIGFAGFSQGSNNGNLPTLSASFETPVPADPSTFAQPISECKTITDPEKANAYFEQYGEQFRQFLEQNREDIEQGRMPLTVIPVQIHIVRMSDGTGGVSESTIMDEFTDYINPYYVPANLGFEFCGATNYIDSDTYYNLSGDAEGDALSAANNVADVLNIYYVNDPDGACGWARFTFMLPSDYIVIANSCAGNQSTTAHEIGHYFDLFHTHETANGAELVTRGGGANCATAGDGHCDTEAEPGSSISGLVTAAPGCSYTGTATDANGDTYIANPTNIMSYAPKTCRTVFTTEQIAKVIFTQANGRSYVSSSGGNCCALDTDAPIVTCDGDQTVLTDFASTGNCNSSIDFNVSITEACGWDDLINVTNLSAGIDQNYTITSSGPGDATFTILNVPIWLGVNTLTYTVTDDQGNVGTCTAEITLDSNEPPTEITVSDCPTDISTGTDAGVCSAVVSWTEPTAELTGGCSLDSPTISSSHNPGDVFPVGTTQVTYTFTYPGLAAEFCFFDVIVTDTEDPVFTTAPADITVNNDPGVCGASVGIADGYTWLVTDNCGVASVVTTIGPGIDEVFPIGTTTVNLKALDAEQNEANHSFQVTVNDTESPTIVSCPSDIELSFNLNCTENAPVLPDYSGLPVFSDNCGVTAISQSPAPGTALSSILGAGPWTDGDSFTVNVVATDAAGNTMSPCAMTVTLNDAVGPHIACPGDQIVWSEDHGDGSCNIAMPDFTGLASAGVLCGNEAATVSQSPAAGTIYTKGDDVTVTLTATDGNGNSEACSFNAHFDDNTKPVLGAGGCGADPAEVTTAIGACEELVILNAPDVYDNCDNAPTIYAIRGDNGERIDAPYMASFGVCETTVDWYAEDDCENISDLLCSNTVLVKEPINQNNEPFAACKEAIRGLNNLGEATVCAEELADDAAGDACSDITVTMALVESLSSPTPAVVDQECITFTCENVGLNYVVVQFEDCSGNKNFCKTTVLIEDNQHPYIACPGDIQIECDMDNNGDPLAFDPSLPLPAHLPAYPQANVPVDLAVLQAWIDAGYGIGNPSPGQDAENGITGLPLAFDNCGATITYENKYYLVSDVTFSNPLDYVSDLPINDPHECDHHNYNIIRTWTVTDVNKGLTASCDQLIQVRDTTDPVISPNGIADATLECSDDAGIAAALAPVPTAADNCYLADMVLVEDNSSAPEEVNEWGSPCVHKRITRRWVATDACGNSSELVQILDLIDTTAPELTVTIDGTVYTGVGPHTVVLDTDSSKCDRNTFFSVTSSDNCDEILLDNYGFLFGGSPIMTSDIVFLNGTAEFNRVLEKGVTPFEVSVVDDCLNATIVTFLITIEDNEDPILECNDAPETYFTSDADVITSDVNGDCNATIPILTPPFMDNCPQGSGYLEYDLNGGGWFPIPAGEIFAAGPLSVGTHTIMYRLTDDAGNTSDVCTKTYTIVDDEDPLLVCPTSKTQAVDADGTADCTLSYIDGYLGGNVGIFTPSIVPGIFDNCAYTAEYTLTGATTGSGSFTIVPGGIFSPATSPELDIDFNVGNTSVVYTAMDAEGNMVQCSFSVTVYDNIDPVITCPADITASADAGVCTYTADVAPVVSDNCAVDRVEYVMSGASAGSGSIAYADLPDTLGAFAFAVGTTYVTYTVYDEQGNDVSCSYQVTITDDENPVVGCPDDYLVGTSGTIYVNGTTGATLPLDQLVYSASDCETTVDGLEVTTTDNCCVSSVQYRILDATDGSIYQNWIAYQNMPTPPDADQTIDLSGQVFEKGEWIVELRAWDCHMNEGVCDFTVTVFDDEAPAFDYCPGDIAMNNLPGECFNNAAWVEPELDDILDNCLPECPVSLEGPYVSFDNDNDLEDIDPDINVIGSGNVFASFPVGTRYVKYKATDDAGNTVFCIFSVTITDVENPAIECPANSTLSFDLDCDTTTLGDYRGLAILEDNCGIDVAATTQSPAPGTLISDIPGVTPNSGETFTVTITTYDLSGNASSCDFEITIDDNVGPYIACPANQVVYTGDADTDCLVELADYTSEATAGVLCGNEEPTVSQSPAPGTLIAGPINIVTLTATDSQGNSTACSFNVGVVDNTAPTGFCYADPETVIAPIGECSEDVLLRAPSVTDNCDASLDLIGVRSDGEADIVATSGAFISVEFSVYETTVTWIATDDAGNSSLICENTVIVMEAVDEDNEPNAGCSDKTFGLKNSGTVTLCADDFGSATDDCVDPDELTLLLHVEGSGDEPSECITFDCGDIGTFEICLIAMDQSGNEDRCYSYVTIQDKRDPHIKCPADITIACHNDNGGDPDPGVAVPFDAISPFDQVTFDAWNPSTDAGADAVNGITGAPLAMDNCGGTVTYTDLSTQGTDPTMCDYYTYDVVRTWRVEDNYGAIAECSQNIAVKDTIAPYFTTPAYVLDRFINCDDPNADAWLNAALALEPEAEDLCYVTLELISDETSEPFTSCVSYLGQGNIFMQRTRVWKAEDACGNFVNYTQVISYQDFTAPAIECPNGGATIDVVVDAGICSVEVPLVASATDCQDVEFYYVVKDVNTGVTGSPVAGNDATQTFGPGNYCIQFYAEDPCGNESTCQVFVNVTDDQAPVIDCTFTNDQTVYTSGYEGACEGIASLTSPFVSDNCGADLYVYSEGASVFPVQYFPFTGFTFGQSLPVGETTFYWYAVDAAGNYSDTCVQVITVLDDVAPIEVGPHFCPTEAVELTTSIDGIANYNCSAPYNWKTPELYDDCGVVSYECVITQGEATLAGPSQTTSGSSTTFQFPVGTSTVAYLASDAAGNTWTCSFDVIVTDNEAPIVSCQDILMFLDTDGLGHLQATESDIAPYSIDGGTYDNCEVYWTVSDSLFDCTELGANEVTLYATDAAGNSMSCTATVTVLDIIPPTITCAADASVTTSGDGILGDCDYVVSGGEFDPTADDNTYPACALTVSNDYNGSSSLDGEYLSATGSPYVITWTVEDAAGNTATCTTTIEVSDDEAPSFSYCPADIEQDALTNNCLSLVNWVEPTMADVDDNCEVATLEGPFVSDPTVQIVPQSNGSAFGNFPIGTTTVSYVVTDIYGNATTCEFDVTVNDNQAPLILFFEDYYEMPFDGSVCGATVDVLPPVAYDQCGELTYYCEYTGTDSGLDDYPAGEETEVTWIVTDEAGNSTSVTAIVKVDRIGPASNLQAICRPDKGFVKFKFDPADGAQRYLIQVRELGGTEFLWVERNYNANVNVAYLPMDSLPTGDYQWRVVSLCKLDDAPNLPGWSEYTKRYTAWNDISLPCGTAPLPGAGAELSHKALVGSEYSVEIFPNPNTGTFNITTDMEVYNLEVMDAEGKLVYSMNRVTDQFMEMNLNELNNGIYLVRLIGDDSVVTKRVTIQR